MANTSSSHRSSKQLAKALSEAQSEYNKQLKHTRSKAEKHLNRAKYIEAELKTLQADIDVAVHGRPMSVSLLHKAISGTAYIKARCWWHGKQREVQIGTIPAVLKRISAMASPVQLPGAADLTWEEMKGNAEIIDVVKDMAREKLRRYISKRLLAEYQSGAADEEAQSGPESDVDAGLRPATVANDRDDWYEQWGRAN